MENALEYAALAADFILAAIIAALLLTLLFRRALRNYRTVTEQLIANTPPGYSCHCPGHPERATGRRHLPGCPLYRRPGL